jgi:hypothetical protein
MILSRGTGSLLMTPGTVRSRNDEITTNGMLPFQATPLEAPNACLETEIHCWLGIYIYFNR